MGKFSTDALERKISSERIIAKKGKMFFLLYAIGEAMRDLTQREQYVLTERFGLDGGGIKALEEIGRHFNVTKERIRQVEAKALRKLMHPMRRRKLEVALEKLKS